jgi:hypothetical protein
VRTLLFLVIEALVALLVLRWGLPPRRRSLREIETERWERAKRRAQRVDHRLPPGSRQLILGPGAVVTALHLSASADALAQLASGEPPAVDPARCDACPAFGCDACRKDAEPSLLRALLDADAGRERILAKTGIDIGDGSPDNPTRSCRRCHKSVRSFLPGVCPCPQPLVGPESRPRPPDPLYPARRR